MLLSVIIVNYNVKYFLEQCLCSVGKAIDNRQWTIGDGQTEVIVVDNNSSDGSVDYLRAKYPFVQFISNTENVGFGRANNRALQQATGKYILFLNPDTIVPGNVFAGCTRFMEEHADAGALGVRMIDGSGQFLKESKRGFPSPWVSFCKMSGLVNLFPSSKFFTGYYLGHLPENETHAIDILPGAYMLVRKEVLDKTGGFDEQFFMYGEDIDLSYRIEQAGYKNYYFPACTIIHFKGESTRKDSRYIKLFYRAMIQFVRKHFSGSTAWFYTGLLKAAIWWKGGQKSEIGSKKYEVVGSVALITGDEESMKEVQDNILNKTITTGKGDAGEIIFCEGVSFSFQQIIGQMQDSKNGNNFFIHGQGTHSVVGSHSKDRQGTVLVLHH